MNENENFEPHETPAQEPQQQPARFDKIEDAVQDAYEKVKERGKEGAAHQGDKAPQNRDAKGKFNPKNEEGGNINAPAAKEIGQAAEDSAFETDAKDIKPVRRPPPGFSPQSKVYYDELPDYFKADIAKREEEISKGFAANATALEKYKSVEKYAEMAEKGGTTLDKALDQYVGLESLLRRDPFAGVERVLQNLGINPVSFANAYIARVNGGHQSLPNSAPSAHQSAAGIGSNAHQSAIDPQAIIQQATSAIKQELEEKRIREDIARMASNPQYRFFDNVRPIMAQLVQAGMAQSFEDAYEKACKLHPEVSQLSAGQQPLSDNKKAAVDKARQMARATLGAPAGGVAKPAATKNLTGKNDTLQDVLDAVNQVKAKQGG